MMPIRSAQGDVEAHIFYIAYTLDGVTDPARRRLMFSFNGGPGSSSVWLHLGALGPKRVKMQDDGAMPPPPYQLAPNPSPGSTAQTSSSSTSSEQATAAPSSPASRPSFLPAWATSRASASSSASSSPATSAGPPPCSSSAKATAPPAPPASLATSSTRASPSTA